MNKFLFTLFIFVFLLSCTNRKDYILDLKKEANTPPIVQIKKQWSSSPFAHTLLDTILLTEEYHLDCSFVDEDLPYLTIDCKDNLLVNANEIIKGSSSYTFVPSVVGDHVYSINVTDKYGKTDKAQLFLYVYKTTPTLLIRKSGTLDSFSTLVKDSVKAGTKYYTDFSIFDGFPNSINYSINELQGTGTNNVDLAKKQFEFAGSSLGLHKYAIVAKNKFNLTSTCNAELTFFANILPVSDFIVTKTKVNDPYEIHIDASASLDPDLKFGGGISMYEFNIDSYKVTTPTNYINYILPGAGTYSIKVRVQDNDGAWSQYKAISFTF
jgi:hypothetical protein